VRLVTTIREEASLASKQAQSDEIKENSRFRALAVKFSDKAAQKLQEARRLKSRKAKSQFLDACSTYNHQTAWNQTRKAGTTSWIYQKEEYKQWSSDLSYRGPSRVRSGEYQAGKGRLWRKGSCKGVG
jgi:hypothetical protein